MRFEHLGNLSDIQNAIIYLTEAVSLTPDGHVEKPVRLSSLGNSYEQQFTRSGEILDIDRAVEHLSRAVLLDSEERPGMSHRLYHLGSSYHTRFGRLGDISDIDKAISHLNHAISLSPGQHLARHKLLAMLSTCYQSRFDRLRDFGDISKAIDFGSQAVHLLPSGHTSDVFVRDCLGNAYRQRFEQAGDASDINQALNYQSYGLSIVPDNHTARPALLNNLANSYESRFKGLVQVDDIDKAIFYRREATRLVQEQESRPAILLNLAVSYELRFACSSELTDVEEAIYYFQQATKSLSGHPYLRLRSARRWGRLAFHHQISSPLEAYQHVMNFIPHIIGLGLSVSLQYEKVNSLNDVVVEAAMVAIDLGEFDTALEWLEGGRSIVWTQMLQLRTPLDRLRAADATLAGELERVSKALNTSHEAMSEAGITLGAPTMEQSSRLQRSLAVEWDELVGRARQILGFQDFLKPKKITELTQAADSGAVVIINVHRHRCDALAILPGSGSVTHIPLPSFSIGTCLEMKEKRLDLLRSPNQLASTNERISRAPIFYPDAAPQDELQVLFEGLWTNVVEPILNTLGYLHYNRVDELPHLTWCTTGPLSFVPLHAAGIYSEPKVRIFDFVVSSYTPTLGALIKQTHSEFTGILAVGQDATPGYSLLPGTIDELDQIQRQAKEISFTRLDGDSANPIAVLSEMKRHSWVHLACHASQDTNPSESAFHLHGGRLSLSQISRTALEHAQLAFLSACQTATGDEKLPEEAVHLAAGMIIAGYSTVIATMWSINDADAPLVATDFYSKLIEDGVPDIRRAARALHDAVGSLREKIGEKNFSRWVPFIHVGR
ncbi:hypothetical protein FS749_000443 [Ceratobasidium sp. UAMH 11750]|nr:hypothetical protein FS749_000443 [Ceratobasidium sp. UAMH 11750]